MKPQNHAPLTHGKVNSLVNETRKKPEKHAPVKHGKVQSLLNETLMKPLTWLHQWTTHVWHTKQLIPWWMKPYRNQKPRASETRGSELTGEWNPKEITKMCTSDTWESVLTRDETLSKPVRCTSETHESELTGEWNPKETTKLCTSDTGETELTGEWNPEEITKPCTSDRWKVNSQVNETLKKLLKRVPLTHGQVYSLELKPWGNQ